MGKIAILFAGQGAQAVGMGQELYGCSPAARTVFDMAESIRPGTQELCFSGPKEQLDITINTQPCVFTADLACAKALADGGVKADAAAGFSLGELPAAAFAGVMAEEEAFRLTCVRAEAMQRCAEANPGEMYAVLRLPAAEVERVCSGISGTYPVNYNCEGQTVVACRAEAAEALVKAISEQKGKAMKLAVSGAFHSPLMADASDVLAGRLASMTLAQPRIALYSNVTGQPYGDAAELLARQVCSPVRWHATVENMVSAGFDTFIEVGPGKTLTGLVKKISSDVRCFNVFDKETLERAIEETINA